MLYNHWTKICYSGHSACGESKNLIKKSIWIRGVFHIKMGLICFWGLILVFLFNSAFSQDVYEKLLASISAHRHYQMFRMAKLNLILPKRFMFSKHQNTKMILANKLLNQTSYVTTLGTAKLLVRKWAQNLPVYWNSSDLFPDGKEKTKL